MAKLKSAKAPTDNVAAKVKTSIWLDSEYAVALNQLAALKQLTLSDTVKAVLIESLTRLPRRECDLVRGMVSSITGRTLRLSGSSGGAGVDPVESQPEATVGQGQSVTGSEKLASRISDIQSRSVDAPISDALSQIYGN
jgi:hypothetical protein